MSTEPGRPRGWRFIDLAELAPTPDAATRPRCCGIILYPVAAAVLLGARGRRRHARSPPTVRIVGSDRRHPYPIRPDRRRRICRPAQRRAQPPTALAFLGRTRSRHRLAPPRDRRRRPIRDPRWELALVHVLTGWPWRFAIVAGLPVLLLAVLLIPLQSASEELSVPGIPDAALGRIVRSRILIAATVGALFGVLHLNTHGPLTMPISSCCR